MKTPNKMVIDGITWRVQEKAPMHLTTDFAGRTNYQESIITLDKRMTADKKANTFLHELIHLVSSSRCLHLEEDDVNSLANGLFDLITRYKLDFRE